MSDSTNGSSRSKAKAASTIRVKVKRQDGPDEQPYWNEFEVEDEGNMNVISCLMAIERNPVTVKGEKVAPPVWDQACLEEVCGSCTMVVNGKVRQACTALTHAYNDNLVLEPMRKFPVIRDLFVDRSRMFENLKRVNAWVPIDGTYDLGPGPKIMPTKQAELYTYSTCMTCGCCLDACPQFSDEGDFIGANTVGQTYLFNENPTGKLLKEKRLEVLMEEDGLHVCGNAQNCAEVCPKEIPLTDAIQSMGRDITVHAIKSIFGK